MSEEDEHPINSAFSLSRAEASKTGLRSVLPLTEDQRKIAELSQAVEKLRAEMSAATRIFEAEEIKKNKLVGDHQKQIKDLMDALAASNEEAAKYAGRLNERADELNKLKSEMAALKTQSDAISKYEKAAKFWGKKSSTHAWSGAISGSIFVSLCVVVLWFGVTHNSEILSALPKNANGEIGLGAVGILFLFALPVVWLLRLFSKFALEHFALNNDAAERQTMMETFLALLGNPKAEVQGEERLLVLRTIFRPAAGATDDGIPIAALEAAKSLIGMTKK